MPYSERPFLMVEKSLETEKFGILPCFETKILIFRISPGVGLRCNIGKHIPIKQHNKPYQDRRTGIGDINQVVSDSES